LRFQGQPEAGGAFKLRLQGLPEAGHGLRTKSHLYGLSLAPMLWIQGQPGAGSKDKSHHPALSHYYYTQFYYILLLYYIII